VVGQAATRAEICGRTISRLRAWFAFWAPSDAARHGVAVHVLPARADEEHAVAGRIALPLVQYLAVRNLYLGSVWDMRAAQGRIVAVVVDGTEVVYVAEVISFGVKVSAEVGVGLAAARCRRTVGLAQVLIPGPDFRIHRFPLAEIAGMDRASEDNAGQAEP